MRQLLCLALLSTLVVFAVSDDPEIAYNRIEQVWSHNIAEHGGDYVRLDAEPPILQRSGDWLTLSWSGVEDPSSDDWVAVYVMPFQSLRDTSPVKYQYANQSATHLTEGKGSLRFSMLNMREPSIFVFFRNGTKYPVVAGSSSLVIFENWNEPLQAHLALTSKPDEMRLVWVTKDSAKPVLKWGTEPDQYNFVTSATTTTYERSDFCGPPATTIGYLPPGMLHSAVMHSLEPNTRYYYAYGSDEGGFATAEVVTGPLPSPDSTIQFLAFGDMGQAEEDVSREESEMVASLNTTRLMAAEVDDMTVLLHIGDISYARGYGSQWDVFFSLIRPIATRIPYMTCIGNHEVDYPHTTTTFNGTDSGGECGVAYEKRMQMPTAVETEPWYSFDSGPVHFVLMSTEHDFMPNSKQRAWIEQDLKSVNRSVTPWIVFSGHRPMYIDSTNNNTLDGDTTVAANLTLSLESLFIETKVDLCLWGHHHSYQRTCAVFNNTCVPPSADGSNNAPVHMVIGMAGAGFSTNIEKKQPAWFEHVDITHHGYARASANATQLSMSFVSDVDGSIVDSVTLKRSAA